jgi:small subunit ribosomal protein S9
MEKKEKATAKKATKVTEPVVEKKDKVAKPEQSVKSTAAKPAEKAAQPRKPKAAGATAPLAHGVGRRKSAVARIWVKRGKGSLVINEKNYKDYFNTDITRLSAAMPLIVYPQAASYYDITANVTGGGISAQADAVKLGIARALIEINPDLRPLLKEHDLLSVDARVKERKKYGQKAARRKFQFVKR